MDFDESPQEAAFRAQARAWLEDAASSDAARTLLADPSRLDGDWVARAKGWQGYLADHGWAGITWPTDAGGRGGTPAEAAIFAEEAARFGLRGEEVWCQLFSEPGAGSDLAGLSSRAERDGDGWVVNGQKVWTSGAHHSDLGILLARTDADRPKHQGISYFLVDMHTPGVEVRPLRQMTGASHFNDELVELAAASGVTAHPIVRQELAASYTRAQIMRYLGYRSRTRANLGLPPGPESSVRKLLAAWNLKHNGELALAVQRASGMLVGRDAAAEGRWQQSFLSAPSIRIAGGSDEIQRNVIAERTLGLPRDPRVDKGVPFRQLGRGRG